MNNSLRLTFLTAAVAVALVTVPRSSVHASKGAGGNKPVLEMYTVTVDAAGLAALRESGQDIATVRQSGSVYEVDIVLWRHQKQVLAQQVQSIREWEAPGGLTAYETAIDQAEDGFEVWKPFDGSGGLLEEMRSFAAAHPDIVSLVELGLSVQGRPIVALKVTRDAKVTPDGSRPAVLYQSLQHAREWISTEVTRRLLLHFVNSYGSDPQITELVDTRELWFIPVLNPDGYQLTHDPDLRYWRKNLRDNDLDGAFTWAADGVDLNRNYDAFWGYDNEGSDGDPAGWTYRGPHPASEPETQAIQGLLDRVGFAFMVNYHSVGGLLLYGPGWQVDTAMADDPISEALSGTDALPAIPGFDPQTSGDLYTVNGDTCDYGIYKAKVLCWTPELTDGGSGYGFAFPDDEALVQKEFVDNLAFALDLALSAPDPAHPVSHLGNTVEPMYPDTFAVSYGDPQVVQVNAERGLGAVRVHWRVNEGPDQEAATTEWAGGTRYGVEGDIHYHRLRGEVSGARAGDRVTVWFEAGGESTEPFTYTLAVDTGNPVLIVAAEERPAVDPSRYAAVYQEALAANGVAADTYDVDLHKRVAPSTLGVLNHYDAVVWYGGDRPFSEVRGTSGKQASRLTQQLQLAMREYLNQGGRLLYAGQWAAFPYFAGQPFNPYADTPCSPAMRCKPLTNDFMQYYLGVGGYGERARAETTMPNRAGPGGGVWSTAANNQEHYLVREFDLTGTDSALVLSFSAEWALDAGWDFAYVEVSTDSGSTWRTLEETHGLTRDRTPDAEFRTWALTGTGKGRLGYDLTPYVGRTILVRIRTFTDYWWVPTPGLWIDELTVGDGTVAIHVDDFDTGLGRWQARGWVTVPFTEPAVSTVSARGSGDLLSGMRLVFGSLDDSATAHSGALLRTNVGLPKGMFPLWDSSVEALYNRPTDGPRTGELAMFSGPGASTDGYQRISRTLTVPRTEAPPRLSFWTSYDIAPESHAFFVEARPVGTDDWTTLPDDLGHTSPREGLYLPCAYDVPQLGHYMTPTWGSLDWGCQPRGTTGAWNAATGRSDGWEPWSIDLSAYAGREIEIAITYLSLYERAAGVMLDDLTLPNDKHTSFENDLAGWKVGSAPSPNPQGGSQFHQARADDYPMGAVITTDRTVTFGFGLEGISSTAVKNQVVGKAIAHLLGGRRGANRIFLPAARTP